MKFTFNGLTAIGAFFITLFFLGGDIAHAQSNSGQHSAPWGDAAKKQRASPEANQPNTPSKAESPPPAQTARVEPSATSERDSGSCAYSTPDDETFLCKMIRIFYGPDTPRGPNPDVEQNLSAGGAGG
ncbi:MAG TPA: hypothetical protein VHB01_11125 [Nitrosospira sp.]|nr:hypothetical protein [Nitrosospira sp.]